MRRCSRHVDGDHCVEQCCAARHTMRFAFSHLGFTSTDVHSPWNWFSQEEREARHLEGNCFLTQAKAPLARWRRTIYRAVEIHVFYFLTKECNPTSRRFLLVLDLFLKSKQHDLPVVCHLNWQLGRCFLWAASSRVFCSFPLDFSCA